MGKSTAITGMRQRHPEMFFSVSVTTRPKRAGDQNGVTYWFKSKEEFESMANDGDFYEYAEYAGNYYGTPKAPVERRLDEGIDVIMDIDVQGALQIQRCCPDAVSRFFSSASLFFVRTEASRKRRYFRGRHGKAPGKGALGILTGT